MKNLLIPLLPLIAVSTASAQKISVSSNAFIQMPVYETYNVAAPTSLQKELGKNCQEFKTFVEAYKDMPEEAKLKIFTTRRDQPGEWQEFIEPKFKISFNLPSAPLKNLLIGIDKKPLAAFASSLKSTLPFDIQVPESVEVMDPSTQQSFITVTGDSLSSVAKTLGLPYGSVQVVRTTGQWQVQILSRDLACDLLEGKAQLTLKTKALVRPGIEAQDQMGQFYFDLSKAVDGITKSKSSLRRKAAKFGMMTGKLLENNAISNFENRQYYLESLMDFVFVDDNLRLSPLWSQMSNGEVYINLQKTTETTVLLQIITTP